jgi:hypothetical protein
VLNAPDPGKTLRRQRPTTTVPQLSIPRASMPVAGARELAVVHQLEVITRRFHNHGANGADEALVRLEGMALLAGIPLDAARAQVAAALDLVVAIGAHTRPEGWRRVRTVVAVELVRGGARTEELWGC